ncbi:hypothetical protein KOM00_08950 [Geomonas sp. Red69]|uniref:Uncharacterized protein n=1 Tax=Geomonas diazotrophica TaxID=2843197 RepID=A0ABX8JDH4_9BACT|nr:MULTISPECIES: hypothetical protein [Geomonas]MBU5636861.1 hypothetical protein [Geomonas diazotrophica]QWV96445.1 hypothetical protein KP005_13825 [Geomonas nitrogeniifigens]
MLRTVAALTMATMVMTSIPALAQQGKDECLLASQNCKDQVDSIQQKIAKLNKEIAKGKKVYTPTEIKVLQGKLREVNNQLDDLLKPGH